jgi:hypothetical protein
MSETGGIDIGMPSEGQTGAPEQLSEEAKARFAAAGAAMAAIRREEKRSKKRDARVAKTIIQFLNDDKYSHLFVLISRLVARDCPSIFILAVLSLINDECTSVVQEYLQEEGQKTSKETVAESLQLIESAGAETNKVLVEWITRMQMVMALDAKGILLKLMVDETNIDGTVLQLTTFVLQEFFRSPLGGNRNIPFENLHVLSASMLQTVFEPFLEAIDRSLLAPPKKKSDDDEDDD